MAGAYPRSELKYYKTNEFAFSPTYASTDSAGLELRAPHDVEVKVGCLVRIDTGLRFRIPRGYCAHVVSHNDVCAWDVHVVNGLDSSNQLGETSVFLKNMSQRDVSVPRGIVIGILLVVPVLLCDPIENGSTRERVMRTAREVLGHVTQKVGFHTRNPRLVTSRMVGGGQQVDVCLNNGEVNPVFSSYGQQSMEELNSALNNLDTGFSECSFKCNSSLL
jgi:dUTPase